MLVRSGLDSGFSYTGSCLTWAHFLMHADTTMHDCGGGQMQQPGGNFGYRDMRVSIDVFDAAYLS